MCWGTGLSGLVPTSEAVYAFARTLSGTDVHMLAEDTAKLPHRAQVLQGVKGARALLVGEAVHMYLRKATSTTGSCQQNWQTMTGIRCVPLLLSREGAGRLASGLSPPSCMTTTA